ncbi:hypothetical protein ABGB07_36110 [Micromonosporaceae bacterium B7E4]
MTDADAILLGARLAEDTVPVCTRGDLVNEFRRLDRELAQVRVQAAADPRIAGTGSAELQARLDDLRQQIEAATIQFKLRALSPKRWRDLVDEHPPRKMPDGSIHQDDQGPQVNNETFFPALVRLSTVEPKLRDETWAALLDPDQALINVQQFLRLGRACWDLNKDVPDVPFSFADWLRTRGSVSGSGSPAPSASPSADSTAGSPSE